MKPIYQILTLVLSALMPQIAGAEDCNCKASHREIAASPYAGMERRSIKALSDQQIVDLKAGRGMGLALSAELNGYPGPAHVLELADALRLSENQRTNANALFEAMKMETIPIGERILSEETALDRQFAGKQATQDALNTATARIASAQGDLRATHLRYHLAMRELLSSEQAARYAELRGYRTGAPDQHKHP